MEEVSSFALSERARDFDPGGLTGHHERLFLDYVIDGNPLYEQIRHTYDLISPLWIGVAKEVQPALVAATHRLLGDTPSGLSGSRTPIYVCSLCGDLSCGGLTVMIEKTDLLIRWRDWGYQNDYEDEISPVKGSLLSDLVFERREYERVIRQGLQDLVGMDPRGGETAP